jgi:hypothetical protein
VAVTFSGNSGSALLMRPGVRLNHVHNSPTAGIQVNASPSYVEANVFGAMGAGNGIRLGATNGAHNIILNKSSVGNYANLVQIVGGRHITIRDSVLYNAASRGIHAQGNDPVGPLTIDRVRVISTEEEALSLNYLSEAVISQLTVVGSEFGMYRNNTQVSYSSLNIIAPTLLGIGVDGIDVGNLSTGDTHRLVIAQPLIAGGGTDSLGDAGIRVGANTTAELIDAALTDWEDYEIVVNDTGDVHVLGNIALGPPGAPSCVVPNMIGLTQACEPPMEAPGFLARLGLPPTLAIALPTATMVASVGPGATAWTDDPYALLLDSGFRSRCTGTACVAVDPRLEPMFRGLVTATGDEIEADLFMMDTFRRGRIELLGDLVGDDDGLCEVNEACLYAPEVGAWQGDDSVISAPSLLEVGSQPSLDFRLVAAPPPADGG